MITKVNQKKLAKALDKWHKAKGLIEVIDGPLFKIIVNYIDNLLSGKIPEKHTKTVNKFIELISEEKFEEASIILGTVLTAEIPTPVIDNTPLEGVLYNAVLKQIIQWFFIPGEGVIPPTGDPIEDKGDENAIGVTPPDSGGDPPTDLPTEATPEDQESDK